MPVPARRSALDPQPSTAGPRDTLAAHRAARAPDAQPLWTPTAPAAAAEVRCVVSADREAALLAAFDAPLIDAPTRDLAFGHKERGVAAVVETLTPVEGLALARRFSAARKDDPIVQRLAQFEPSRRARLITFVTDPKLRAARAARR